MHQFSDFCLKRDFCIVNSGVAVIKMKLMVKLQKCGAYSNKTGMQK